MQQNNSREYLQSDSTVLNRVLRRTNDVKEARAKVDRVEFLAGSDVEDGGPPDINASHIYGLPMETVNADYTRNIYFTVRTTNKYYTKRLLPVTLTWLQVVDRNKVSQ